MIDYEAIIAAGQEWEDPTFPTIASSLMDEKIEYAERINRWSSFVWKRPKEVYGAGNFTLYKKIGPNDVIQGAAGDCYFLATLSSMAEHPDRIKNIFITKEPNDAGCYAVTIYVNGEKRTVVVDD